MTCNTFTLPLLGNVHTCDSFNLLLLQVGVGTVNELMMAKNFHKKKNSDVFKGFNKLKLNVTYFLMC